MSSKIRGGSVLYALCRDELWKARRLRFAVLSCDAAAAKGNADSQADVALLAFLRPEHVIGGDDMHVRVFVCFRLCLRAHRVLRGQVIMYGAPFACDKVRPVLER